MARAADIIDQALRLVNRVDASYRQRALDALDRNVRYYATKMPWPALRRKETFVYQSGEYFTFPSRVQSIEAIGDVTTKAYVGPGAHFERQFPDWEMGTKPSGGGPFRWRALGDVQVVQDPSSPSKIKLNTTASDSQSVYVRGLAQDTTASGTALEYFEASEIVVAQETPVESTNLYHRVEIIEADLRDRSSDIKVIYSTGSLPAARIPKNERTASYRKIQWLATPTTGSQFEVLYLARPAQIASESQQLPPEVPDDFLVWRVVGDLQYLAEQPQAAALAWQRADQLVGQQMSAELGHNDNLIQAIPYAPMVDTEDDFFA